MGDLSARLDGCVIFSKLDLQQGFYQVLVAAPHVAKTAIIMPFGLFEFLCMQFSLKNTGMMFQRLMDRIFFDLPYSFVCLDDYMVASKVPTASTSGKLCSVFRVMDWSSIETSASLASPASNFWARKSSLLAFRHCRALLSTARELQVFLGLFNFYRCFVPAAAAIVKPLTDALGGSPSGNAPVHWSADRSAAFEQARKALASTALLDNPASNAAISLVIDASETHVGAVLQQQRRCEGWRPLFFFLRI
jgi:RNase H-like domain found in reverse transcriptase